MLSSIAPKDQDPLERLLRGPVITWLGLVQELEVDDQPASHGGHSMPLPHVPRLDVWMQPDMALRHATRLMEPSAIHKVKWTDGHFVLEVLGQDTAHLYEILRLLTELSASLLRVLVMPELRAQLPRIAGRDNLGDGFGAQADN